MTLLLIFARLFGIYSGRLTDWSDLHLNKPNPASDSSDFSQLELSLEEIAMIFAVKGWVYDTGKAAGAVPTPDNITDIIEYLISVIEVSEMSGVWTNLGRFMVTQDPEYPSYYSLSLELGLIPKKGG